MSATYSVHPSIFNCIFLTALAIMIWDRPANKMTGCGARRSEFDHQQSSHFLFAFTTICLVNLEPLGAKGSFPEGLITVLNGQIITPMSTYTSRAWNLIH